MHIQTQKHTTLQHLYTCTSYVHTHDKRIFQAHCIVAAHMTKVGVSITWWYTLVNTRPSRPHDSTNNNPIKLTGLALHNCGNKIKYQPEEGGSNLSAIRMNYTKLSFLQELHYVDNATRQGIIEYKISKNVLHEILLHQIYPENLVFLQSKLHYLNPYMIHNWNI